MLLRMILLLFFTFPLLSLSCSRDSEPEPAPADGTFMATASGGLNFDVSGTTKSYLIYYSAKNETLLDVDFIAPDGQWHSFSINVWNFDREGVEGKTYIKFEGSPISDEHSFQTILMPDTTPTGWNKFKAGQIKVEYYGTDRIRGTFDGTIESNAIPFDSVDPIVVSGSFDTAFERITK